MSASPCQVCIRSTELGLVVETSKSKAEWGRLLGLDESSVRRHLKHRPAGVAVAVTPASYERALNGDITAEKVADRIIPLSEWLEDLKADGFDPADFTTSHAHSIWGQQPRDEVLVTLYANKFSAVQKTRRDEPDWPVIQPAAPVVVAGIVPIPRPASRWKTAVLMADTQIGFRRYEDGTLDPFHDDDAMNVALQIVALENPDRTVVMGDILDLAEQGKFAQEAAFANTTQAALDRTHLFGAQMRAATDGLVDWIEGNHDRRMQNFIEANAKAAFGLRQANMPDSWPVMSIPNLLRLSELDITYHDAYPAAHVWINDCLRAEHGTKVNSNGSTAQKYMNETPHLSRAFGHTHRLEAISRTTYDRVGKLRSMAINPGCLCRVDGAVPSVHGAIGGDGRPATVYEDWQNGVAVIRYTDDDFRVDLVQIEDGMTVYMGQEIRSTH